MGSIHILILAAGKGTRMKSKLPKVLHPVLFRPMLHHVLDLATSIAHDSVTTVVGYGENLVRESCKSYEGVSYVTQKEQKGTADAVMASKVTLSSAKGKPRIS